MPNIEGLSDEELMEAWTEEGKVVAAGKARLREFSEEHQRRERKKQLARFASLSAEDLALIQEVQAEGLESEEKVGEL